MMDDPIVRVERGVPRQWKRLLRPYLIGIVVLALVAGVAIYFAWSANARLADVRSAERRNECGDRLIGFTFDAAARTLAAPPAPNPERTATATDFIEAARRLSDADRVCAATHDDPAPLPPTPVP